MTGGMIFWGSLIDYVAELLREPESVFGVELSKLNEVVPGRHPRIRKRKWTAGEIRRLLEWEEEHGSQSMLGKSRWYSASKRLLEEGFDRSANACEHMWGVLLRSYIGFRGCESETRDSSAFDLECEERFKRILSARAKRFLWIRVTQDYAEMEVGSPSDTKECSDDFTATTKSQAKGPERNAFFGSAASDSGSLRSWWWRRLNVIRNPVIKAMQPPRTEAAATTEYRGVRYREVLNKYVIEIRLPRSTEKIWLGTYDTAEEEARAFDIGNLFLDSPDAADIPLVPFFKRKRLSFEVMGHDVISCGQQTQRRKLIPDRELVSDTAE